MKTVAAFFAIVILLAVTVSVRPQDPPPPHKVLQIHRDFVKTGKESDLYRLEVQAAQASVKENSPIPYLTLSSVSGQNELWSMIWYESYAEMDRLREEYAKRTALATELRRVLQPKSDLVSGGENLFATHRQDISQGPDVEIAKARFFSITIDRVVPGHITEYEEMQKILKTAHAKLSVQDSHAVYQVISGAANGTFLF